MSNRISSISKAIAGRIRWVNVLISRLRVHASDHVQQLDPSTYLNLKLLNNLKRLKLHAAPHTRPAWNGHTTSPTERTLSYFPYRCDNLLCPLASNLWTAFTPCPVAASSPLPTIHYPVRCIPMKVRTQQPPPFLTTRCKVPDSV
jgi:hypothetical protein